MENQPFYMRLCNGVHEKNQHHFVVKDITVVMIYEDLQGNSIRDASFCEAIANIYYKMVLKIFINTIAKPHVKRLKDVVNNHAKNQENRRTLR